MSIEIENICVDGWQAAIRGARNPMNSWARMDSYVDDKGTFVVGENDLKLLHTLAKAGPDHGKFLRMINVTMDITAPFYWWKEFSTYKVGTVANSCSTMHKIHAKEFTLDDFSHEHLINERTGLVLTNRDIFPRNLLDAIVSELNKCRELFLETNDKKYWWQMIQLLPSSYNQRRTVQLNYAVALNMYKARHAHKLDEWHTFCDTIKTLPYFNEICLAE